MSCLATRPGASAAKPAWIMNKMTRKQIGGRDPALRQCESGATTERGSFAATSMASTPPQTE
jgi:hypothetical protein